MTVVALFWILAANVLYTPYSRRDLPLERAAIARPEMGRLRHVPRRHAPSTRSGLARARAGRICHSRIVGSILMTPIGKDSLKTLRTSAAAGAPRDMPLWNSPGALRQRRRKRGGCGERASPRSCGRTTGCSGLHAGLGMAGRRWAGDPGLLTFCMRHMLWRWPTWCCTTHWCRPRYWHSSPRGIELP